MALNLVGAGGLFTRIGHLIYGVNEIVNTYRGVSLTNRVGVIQSDYANSDQNLIDALYTQLSSARNTNTALINYWRTLAQNTVTQMVNANQPQIDTTYATALTYLFSYLASTSQTVTRNTISVSVTPDGGNRGNAVILLTTLNNLGLPQEQMFQEDIIARVTRDSSAGATASQETLQVTGTYGTTDMLSWAWPQGSNAQATLVAITPKTSGNTAGKNWLINGTMDAFTSNVPTGWHVQIGTPGTTVLQDTASYHDGTSSLKFVGTGSELTSIRSQFGVDFSGKALSLDQLAVNLQYKLSGAASAGVLKISLTDGAGTILLDNSGTPSGFSINLVGVDTAWHGLNGFLRMPSLIPSQVYLTISLSTALTAAVALNLDWISMARPTLFYSGGPQIACFAGSSDLKLNDSYDITTHNSFNGLMQSGCNQLLGLSTYGLVLPSTTGSPTIPDSLVV